tara:strand:+ start:226 stop:828 length:603 start_codon:yes stop_codon:yes gene_type:complete
MAIRNRVLGLTYVTKELLKPNPRNWRTHPDFQKTALRQILSEVGVADACIARKLPDGSLELIDGHMRREESEGKIPVLVLDVTEQEADKLLVSLDPLSELAESDETLLRDLMKTTKVDNKTLRDFIKSSAPDALEEKKQELQQDDTFINNSIKKVIINFESEEYEQVVEALKEAGESLGFEDNTQIIVKLLITAVDDEDI